MQFQGHFKVIPRSNTETLTNTGVTRVILNFLVCYTPIYSKFMWINICLCLQISSMSLKVMFQGQMLKLILKKIKNTPLNDLWNDHTGFEMQLIEESLPRSIKGIFGILEASTKHFGQNKKNLSSPFFSMTSFPRWPPFLVLWNTWYF